MTAPAPTAPKTSTGRAYSLGAVLPHVRRAAELVGAMYGIQSILGWRATARDMTGHPAGRALDYMCTPAQGAAILAFLSANAKPLAVEYLIWQQTLYEFDADGTPQPPEPMEDRGSPTQNHEDHVHANFRLLPGSGQVAKSGPMTFDDGGGLGLFDGWAEDATALGIKLLGVGMAVALVVIGVKKTVTNEED